MSILLWMISYLFILTIFIPSISSFSSHPPWQTSRVELNDVSLSYPTSVWRRLTSSEPRRPFAVQDITFSLQGDFLLLTGASSSGKSTILKLLTGELEPDSGRVQVFSTRTRMETKPVLLQDRPIHSSKETLLKVLDLMDDRFQSTALRNDLASLFSLSLDQPADTFTPSQAYRFSIAKATLEHMNDHGLAAPVILLDEWMDHETLQVVQNVLPCLHEVVRRGGVVISVTHKPHLFKSMDCEQDYCKEMTLNAGTVFSFC